MTPFLVCPACGRYMHLLDSWRFTYPDGTLRRYWRCSAWPLCRVSHSAHPDGRPLGLPADAETRRMRALAHQAFDAWWRAAGLTRSQGYRALRAMLNLPEAAAHIGRFDKSTCALIVAALRS